MGTLRVVDLIAQAADLIQDPDYVRWSQSAWLDYFNAAQREVVNHRPDANAVNASHPCADTSKQALPAGANRLIDVIRNTNTGRVVTQVSRRLLDDHLPDWHNTPVAGVNEVKHFVYDPRDPLHFYLYPKPTTNASVEIVYSRAPAAVTSAQVDLSDIGSETIGLDDSFANALVDYMLFRAYLRDSEYAGNVQEANVHLQAFGNSLGVKMKMDGAITPMPAAPQEG